MATFREPGESVRMSVLLSKGTTERITEISKVLNIRKYEVYDVLVALFDLEDERLLDRAEKNFDLLPPGAQAAFALRLKRRAEGKDV